MDEFMASARASLGDEASSKALINILNSLSELSNNCIRRKVGVERFTQMIIASFLPDLVEFFKTQCAASKNPVAKSDAPVMEDYANEIRTLKEQVKTLESQLDAQINDKIELEEKFRNTQIHVTSALQDLNEELLESNPGAVGEKLENLECKLGEAMELIRTLSGNCRDTATNLDKVLSANSDLTRDLLLETKDLGNTLAKLDTQVTSITSNIRSSGESVAAHYIELRKDISRTESRLLNGFEHGITGPIGAMGNTMADLTSKIEHLAVSSAPGPTVGADVGAEHVLSSLSYANIAARGMENPQGSGGARARIRKTIKRHTLLFRHKGEMSSEDVDSYLKRKLSSSCANLRASTRPIMAGVAVDLESEDTLVCEWVSPLSNQKIFSFYSKISNT